MPFITHAQTWYPVWAILFFGMLWKGGMRGKWFLLAAILAVAAADQGVNQLLKPWIGRVRPCNVLNDVVMLVPCNPSFSMPSSHATNFFAVATALARFYPRYSWVYWSVAGLVGYSRIAVGRHYPGDVLAGALLGILLACGVIWMLRFIAVRRNLKFPD